MLKRIVPAILIILALSGCTAPQTDDTPTPTVTISPTPTVTAAPTPTPEPTPEPTPTPDPYFTSDEEITKDEETGYWLYRSPTLYVEINRIFDEVETQTYFVAEVRLKDGETERAGFGNPERPGRASSKLYKIAANYQAVLAINGDYIDNVRTDKKGIIIRDGVVYVDKNETDTLAFYPDGTMQIFRPDEITAEQLLEDGVKNTFSFGPTLIYDGVIEPDLKRRHLSSRNPRTALGMIEPYHFILIVVDGRQKGYSVGMTLVELADVFAAKGCQVAYNLDGGASATMSFMGENISQYNGSHTAQRSVPDALLFGFTPLLAEPEQEDAQ